MRPFRAVSMNPIGSGRKVELAPGVTAEWLVGEHNHAQNLCTGIVEFAPDAELPCRRRHFGTSITLLDGCGFVDVEGRAYALNVLDNVVIPRGLDHSIGSGSSGSSNFSDQKGVFHFAFPKAAPSSSPPSRSHIHRAMPVDSTGVQGRERINRHQTAPRYQAGPNTSFISYFNRDLVPSIEMSGGYGLFATGGRLPAHVHDFDESICIVQGTATCVVEGESHELSDCATALQPRGRVHYFINQRAEPMAMIWIYAGPTAVRMATREELATEQGAAWR